MSGPTLADVADWLDDLAGTLYEDEARIFAGTVRGWVPVVDAGSIVAGWVEGRVCPDCMATPGSDHMSWCDLGELVLAVRAAGENNE